MADKMTESWKKSICDVIRDEQSESNNIIEMDDESLVINYLTYIRKCIPFPVTVYESNEIETMISDEIKGPYDTIKKRLANGEGVAPYLSSRASKLDFDGLYLDWNILHLHLGNINADSSSAERTGKTLHLMVIGNEAYLIKIGQHGSGAYTDPDEFKIIHNNWPKLLNVLNFIPDQNVNSEDRIKMRNGGVNMFTTFPDNTGKLITAAPVKIWGYSTNKTSTYDSKLLDKRIPKIIKGIAKQAKDISKESERFSEGQFYYSPEKTCFSFSIIDSQENPCSLFEINSNELWRKIFVCDDKEKGEKEKLTIKVFW
ncbi:hypothetical protein [Lactiplantibacillus pentosus]|uniref:hypothetical protein n=1 Tax=Lactiplantibacillus pentosus TaxID=1589 RepID=UPI001C1EA825|nr:hypothetical protein [Lactiplantibacillus pentosus]MBU7494464.1 hypothetical protein [Lactiplantibacillus pentosus]MBU7520476.1 hypothetical protein [Lactiplantibacillus pentosus]